MGDRVQDRLRSEDAAGGTNDAAIGTAGAVIYSGHNFGVTDLVELADRRIASVGFFDDTLQIWHPDDPKNAHVREMRGPSIVIELEDGRVITRGRDATHIWNLDESRPTETIEHDVTNLIKLSDGRIASNNRGETVGSG